GGECGRVVGCRREGGRVTSPAIPAPRIGAIPEVENARAEWAAGARNFLASGYRAVTIMPMIRGDAAIGALSVARGAPGPLSDKQVAVLKTFAAQAVIAIENTRLLNELRQRTDDLSESLEQQTATSEVLRVISSSPGELAPVFHAMLENATRVCGSNFGTLYLREGEAFRAVSMHGATPDYLWSRLGQLVHPGPGTGLGRAVRAKQAVHIADVTPQPAYPQHAQCGAHSAVALSSPGAVHLSVEHSTASPTYRSPAANSRLAATTPSGFRPLIAAGTERFVAGAPEEISLRRALGRDLVAGEP